MTSWFVGHGLMLCKEYRNYSVSPVIPSEARNLKLWL